MKKYCFVMLMAIVIVLELTAIGNKNDILLDQYLEKDARIFAEVSMHPYTMVFIAHDDIFHKDSYVFGDLLFLIMKEDEMIFSSLVYSSSSSRPYYISDDYFAISFKNHDTRTAEITYFNFNDETWGKFLTAYMYLGHLFILNGNLYYTSEKYEKCISRFNFMTSEITEYGNPKILAADFVEYQDKVLALTIYNFPPYGEKNFIIEETGLMEFHEDIGNMKPIKNYLKYEKNSEKRYAYLLE